MREKRVFFHFHSKERVRKKRGRKNRGRRIRERRTEEKRRKKKCQRKRIEINDGRNVSIQTLRTNQRLSFSLLSNEKKKYDRREEKEEERNERGKERF